MKKVLIWMVMVVCVVSGASQGDLFDGLLGYWPLDEGEGLVAGDLVGDNDGVLEAGVNWVGGKLGSAMETNVGTQAIRMSPEPAYLTPNMSMSCWAITEEAGWGNWEGIVGHFYDTGATEAGWGLYEDGAVGTVEFYACQAGTMETLSVSGVPTGVWNHWVGTVSDTAITVYLNGQEQVSLPFAGGVDYNETPATWDIVPTIGTYVDDNENEYFNGSVDEVAIWDRALTADEVAQLYNGGTGFSLPIAIKVRPTESMFVPIDTMLEWAAPEGRVVSAYDVWFGTDPNAADAGSDFTMILDHKDLTTVDPSPAGDLDPDTLYFWRVDMYEPNSLGLGESVSDGMVWSFRTAPDAPVILTQPVGMIIAKGATAEFIVGGSNIQTYTWYRSDDDATDTPADDVVVGDDSSLLSIPDVDLPDEGYYYCEASNGGLMDVSDLARLILERLIHHYPLDGASAEDVVAGVNGTVVGDPNWVDGIDGGAIDMFPASMSAFEDYIVLGEAGDISYGADDFTVSFWMKTPSLSGDPALMSNKDWDSGSNVGWVIAWGGSGDGIYQWNFDTGSPDRRDYDPSGPETADNQWHLVTVAHDRGGNATFYIDGEVRGQVDISNHAGNSVDSEFPTVIGNDGMQNYHDKWNEYTRCAFDDVRIYNFALDSVEVARLYTDFVEGVWICPDGHRPVLDVVENCRVDLADLAAIAGTWLECGRIPEGACNW
jgi:hypothetical protein